MIFKIRTVGFGLLEVMISAAILSVTLMGVASLQSRIVAITIESSRKETAYRMLQQLLNFANIRQPFSLASFLSNTITTASTDSCYTYPAINCSAEVFYATMLKDWKNSVRTIFPSGRSCACVVNHNSSSTPPSVKVRFALTWVTLSGLSSVVYIDNTILTDLDLLSGAQDCPTGVMQNTVPTTVCSNFT